MKRWGLFSLAFLSAQSLYAAPIAAPLNIQENDGSPSCWPYRLDVSTGTLTCNADGTADLSTGGGGSSGASTPNSRIDFSSSTSVNFNHDTSTTSVIVQCFNDDTDPKQIGWDALSLVSSTATVITFSAATSGHCVLNSGSGGGNPSGDITSVAAGYGLSGGGTSGALTVDLSTHTTSYIRNNSTLQDGATAYTWQLAAQNNIQVVDGPIQGTRSSSGLAIFQAFPEATGESSVTGYTVTDAAASGNTEVRGFDANITSGVDSWAFYANAGKSRFEETHITEGNQLRLYVPIAAQNPYVAFMTSTTLTNDASQIYVVPKATGAVDQSLSIQTVDDRAHLYWNDSVSSIKAHPGTGGLTGDVIVSTGSGISFEQSASSFTIKFKYGVVQANINGDIGVLAGPGFYHYGASTASSATLPSATFYKGETLVITKGSANTLTINADSDGGILAPGGFIPRFTLPSTGGYNACTLTAFGDGNGWLITSCSYTNSPS